MCTSVFGVAAKSVSTGKSRVIDLIDRPDEEPWGVDEPSAITNTVFDATGARMRSVPFTPDKMLAALSQGRSS